METRVRVMRPLALLAMLVFAPLVVQNFWRGHWVLAIAGLLVIALLGVNYLALRSPAQRGAERAPLIPHEWVAVPALVGALAAILAHGVAGAFWSFPIVLYGHFVLRRRVALGASLAVAAGVTTITGFELGAAAALRVGGALSLTIAIINIVLDVLIDAQTQLLGQSITDPLTQAYNRRHMEACMAEAVARKRRHGVRNTALLLDIDHFKDVNDFLGHAQGDEALRKVSALIRARLRATDKVFRMGGEEFLVLLSDTSLQDALALAEALRREIGAADWPEGHVLTVSIGVAEQAEGDTWETWVARADIALYRAKRGGRNRVVA